MKRAVLGDVKKKILQQIVNHVRMTLLNSKSYKWTPLSSDVDAVEVSRLQKCLTGKRMERKTTMMEKKEIKCLEGMTLEGQADNYGDSGDD